MRVLISRVNNASVKVNNKTVGKIDKGLLVLVGFTYGDNEEIIDYMINLMIV